MKKFSLIFLTAFLTIGGFSQNTGILKGVVKDKSSLETLIGVRVYTHDLRFIASTDLFGAYTLELPIGEHSIIASYSAYQSDTVLIKISKDIVTTQNFELLEDGKVLKTLVVSAGKFEQDIEELTVSMEVIKSDLLDDKNVASVEEALEQAPGLTIMDGEPQIRGGSGFTFGVGSRVAIVVDDMPLLSGDAGRPEWGFVPVENISQIEVIKGASSVLYGSSALSGVINIRTAYPSSKPKTKISINSGIYSNANGMDTMWWQEKTPLIGGASFLHSRVIKNNLDLVVGGNFYHDNGYIGPPVVEDPIIDTITNGISNQDIVSQRARLNFNLRYRSKKIRGLNYGVNGNGMLAKSNFALAWLNDTSGIFNAYPGAISLQTQKIFNLDLFISYLNDNNVHHTLRTRVFSTDNDITNNQSNSSTLYYGEYQLARQFPFIPDFNFIGGVTGTYTKSKANLYQGSGANDNRVKNFAGYAQIDKKFWKILNISGGLRYEYFKMNDKESVVKPVFRIGGNLRVKKGTNVRASFGQGFRFPTIAERFISTSLGTFGVFPNPDLKPETSSNTEFGIKQGYKFGDFMGYADVAGFYQEYENTIEYLFGVWDQSIALAGFKFLNTGNTQVKGFDVSIVGVTDTSKNFQVSLYAGYTYTLPMSLNTDLVYAHDNSPGFQGGYPLSYNLTSIDSTQGILKYRIQHTGKIDIQLSYNNVSFGWSSRYYSKIRNYDKSIENLEVLTAFGLAVANIYYTDYYNDAPEFQIIHDVRLNYEFNDNFRLSIVAKNVFNKLYSLRPLKVEAPRTTAIQLMYKF